MTQQPSLVLFDLMSTLLRVEPEDPPYWRAIGRTLGDAGLCDAEEFIETYPIRRNEWHDQDVETPLRARLAHYADVPETMAQSFEDNFIDEYKQRSYVIEGVREMLAAWRRVAPLGVVSNYFIAGVPRVLLDHHDLLGSFAFVVDSAATGLRKPNPKIFELALAEGGIDDPDQVLMVGDNPIADVEGARSVGIRAVHFCPVEGGHSQATIVRSWSEFRPGV